MAVSPEFLAMVIADVKAKHEAHEARVATMVAKIEAKKIEAGSSSDYALAQGVDESLVYWCETCDVWDHSDEEGYSFCACA